MGTRGLMGFRSNEKDYLSYNHFDSYPSGLGISMAKFIQEVNKSADTLGAAKAKVDALLLRDCQGNPATTLNTGYMINSHKFLEDSLFCEWAYIVNFDTQKLEVYHGFQTKPHTNGRYAKPKGKKPYPSCENEYFPIALVAEIPFAEATVEKMEGLEKEVGGEDDE